MRNDNVGWQGAGDRKDEGGEWERVGSARVADGGVGAGQGGGHGAASVEVKARAVPGGCR